MAGKLYELEFELTDGTSKKVQFEAPEGPAGKDYVLTAEDKAEIIHSVIAEIGTPIAGTIDDDNNITLGGDLADGTYTVRWVNTSGYAEIAKIAFENGEIVDPDEPEEIKNWLPLATTTLGGTEIYNGTGWKVGMRWSNSSKAPTSSNDTICCVTGIVPVVAGDTVYTFAIPWVASGTEHPAYYIKYFSDGSIVSDNIGAYSGVDENDVSSFEVPEGVVGVRFSGYNMSDASMITVNQYPK